MYKRNFQQQINSLQPFFFEEKQQITKKMDIFSFRTQLTQLITVKFPKKQYTAN